MATAVAVPVVHAPSADPLQEAINHGYTGRITGVWRCPDCSQPVALEHIVGRRDFRVIVSKCRCEKAS